MTQGFSSNIAVVVDRNNPDAVSAAEALQQQLPSSFNIQEAGRGLWPRIRVRPELIVSFGGDRTLLRAVQDSWALHTPYLGVNYGNIGALSNDPEDFSPEVIMEHRYEVHEFPLLRFWATDMKGRTIRGIALNDLALERETSLPGSCHLKITIDGDVFIPELIGNGFLATTPLGSTSYNLNADGPVLDYGLNVIGVASLIAKVPYRLAVFPQETRIRIDVLRPEDQVVNLSYDSEAHPGIRAMEIWMEPRMVRLAFAKPFRFTARLARLARRMQRKSTK